MKEQHSTTLGSLSDDDFNLSPAWEATGAVEDGDKILVPAQLNSDGAVASSVGEVWCQSVCQFANGDTQPATAMYRGDGREGPLAWTVTRGGQELPLQVPPAPSFVLEKDGPEQFAKAFGLTIDEVFPLVIKSKTRFETPPHERSIHIGAEGVLKET